MMRKTSIGRCGCKVQVTAWSRNGGPFKISTCQLEHNHPLTPDSIRHHVKSRTIPMSDLQTLLTNDRAGVQPCKSFAALVVENVGYRNMTYNQQDARNAIARVRRLLLKRGDFAAMRDLFDRLKAQDPDFVYEYDRNPETNVLRNVFWLDGRGRAACDDFGELITFDTTFLKNRYRFPLGMFVGVNNHGMSILLGCALLAGEDTESITWVFKQWLKCRKNKQPVGLLTDQAQSIANAVKAVFPEARHRWCLFHVLQNVRKYFTRLEVFNDLYNHLNGILHESLTILEFEQE